MVLRARRADPDHIVGTEDGQTEIRERRALMSGWRPGVSRDRLDIGAYMEQTDVGQART